MTDQLLRSTASLAVLAGQLLGGFASPQNDSADQVAPVVETPAVVFTDTPAEVQDMAEWAIALFDQAGMTLPAIEFNFHGDDMSGCSGHEGLHRPNGAASVIELCTSAVSFPTQATILHEFAHAWVEHNADETTLGAFQELRGYEHWLDYSEAAWHENGTEQAAEIMVWGLVDRPMSMIRIPQNSCDDLLAGYVTLTGEQPLHGFRDLCSN